MLVSLTAKLPASEQGAEQAQIELPTVVTKLRNVAIVKTGLRNPGSRSPTVVIEVKNNSDVPIMAMTVSYGRDGRRSIIEDGALLPDRPREIVLAPHATRKFRISLANIDKGTPVVVSGAIYADGMEDGEPRALKVIHEEREHERERRKAQKGMPEP
ncbi:MAG TPA: hypothetical protein VF546_11505 [Pyrinomonadaceae bacterium]|jgi:hypothetical protein